MKSKTLQQFTALAMMAATMTDSMMDGPINEYIMKSDDGGKKPSTYHILSSRMPKARKLAKQAKKSRKRGK
jgi:hypothetical protein